MSIRSPTYRRMMIRLAFHLEPPILDDFAWVAQYIQPPSVHVHAPAPSEDHG